MEQQLDAGIDVSAGTPSTPARRRRLPAWVTRSDTWIGVGVLTVVAALAGAVLWLLWLLVTALVDVATATGNAAADAGQTALDRLSTGSIIRTITGPVHAYIDSHVSGLPATADQVWWGWVISGAVLLACASYGSRGARIGWTLHGAVTAAMVWAASPADNRELAVAITVGVWSLLAVPAFTRRAAGHTTVVVTRPTGADSAESVEVAR